MPALLFEMLSQVMGLYFHGSIKDASDDAPHLVISELNKVRVGFSFRYL